MPLAYFETIRVIDGEPMLLQAHLNRLARVPGGVELSRVRDAVAAALVDARGEQLLRIETDGTATTAELRALPPHAASDPELPLSVALVDSPGYSYPHKSTERSLHETLLEQALVRGATEALITDDGEVIEGVRTNVFLVNGEIITTTPLGRCLPGVTRAALLELAPTLGLKASEQPISVEQLSGADEILLSNALIGVRSVDSVDSNPVGGHAPGLRDRLHAALLDHYDGLSA